MKRIMLLYPPGKLYQRGEDRCQGNIEDSAATAMRACNDLGYAAAVLIKRGYEVFLKDYQTEKLHEDDLIKDIENFKPDMIVASVTNATIFTDIELMKRVKQYHKGVTVLKGAIFYDAEDALLELLDLSEIDVLIGGELDFAIGMVADQQLKGIGKLEDIHSIIYKTTDGQLIKTDFHVWDNELDGQPFPARALMNNELYTRPDTGEPMATIQTSRGCPASCIYCLSPDISGKRVRFRSPQNVFFELKECYFQHGIRNFFFKADTFTIDGEWVKELCQLITTSELNKKISFTANSRVNPLEKETLVLMKKAGCFSVAFGFESGSDETLKLVKKGATVEQNRRAMQWAREAGLQVYGFYMIGFPWETKDDIQKTIDLIYELNTDFIEIHIALPYYGTELYDICSKEDLLIKGTYGNDYFHSNTTGTKYVSMEELIQIRKNVLLKYYLRPSYILNKMIHTITKPKVFGNYVRYGCRMIGNLLSSRN